jgi:hypothetical protein
MYLAREKLMKFKTHLFVNMLLLAIASISVSQVMFNKPNPQFTMLSNVKVKLELALTVDQELKLAQILAPITVDYQGKKVFQLGPDVETMDRLEGEAESVLDARQKKRLREIWIQKQGGYALLDLGVAKELGISKPQSEKIKKIATELSDKLMSPQPIRLEPKVLQEYRDRMMKELTPAQNVRFVRMQGAKFLD